MFLPRAWEVAVQEPFQEERGGSFSHPSKELLFGKHRKDSEDEPQKQIDFSPAFHQDSTKSMLGDNFTIENQIKVFIPQCK